MKVCSGDNWVHKKARVRLINKKDTGNQAYRENETHIRKLVFQTVTFSWNRDKLDVSCCDCRNTLGYLRDQWNNSASTTVSTVTDPSNKCWGCTYDLGQWTPMISSLLFFFPVIYYGKMNSPNTTAVFAFLLVRGQYTQTRLTAGTGT